MIDQNGRPVAVGRDYDRAEIALDGVVHGVGLVFGVVGVTVLIVFAARSSGIGDLPVGSSMRPACSRCWVFGCLQSLAGLAHQMVLRRFDHSAIYLLIAATYTPFIAG